MKNTFITPVRTLGGMVLGMMEYLGGISILFSQTLGCSILPPLRFRHILNQMNKVGVMSLPIVLITSLFTGMVLALQSAYQMQKIQAQIYIATLVALSIVRELGPVLTALVIAGRVGAGITAELGTMKVTEQIDALETLATDPVKYLVVPRFLALLIVVPILTVYSDFVGIMGGYLIGVFKLNILHNVYIQMTYDQLLLKDLFSGLAKSIAFAVIICIVGCYQGFTTEGGAEGVGRATTMSVVISFILIIISDCLFTALFYFVLK